MFIDVAKISVKGGKGGNGIVAWRREKFEPSGGPYGGDGGDGGSVILKADEGIRTLMDFRYKRHYSGENGEDGRTKRQYGKKGQDTIIRVPVGTLVKDAKTKRVIVDLKHKDQEFVIAKGQGGQRKRQICYTYQAGPWICRARHQGPGIRNYPGIKAPGRCGPHRLSQCREIHNLVHAVSSQAQDIQLSFYHPPAQSRSGQGG